MTVQTNIFKLNMFTRNMKKLEKMNTNMKDVVSGVQRKIYIANMTQGKDSKNDIKSQNIYLNAIGKFKETKKVTEDILGYVEDVQKYISPRLKKSTKISNFVNNKFSLGAGKLVENMINFTGKVVKKDLKKYANSAKHIVEIGTKELFLGKINPKRMEKLNQNPIAKAAYKTAHNVYDKAKDITKNIDKYSLNDITKKGSGTISKGMKRITNPKITGMMKKVANPELLGKIKNIGNNKLVKGFTKAFSPVGAAMNVHTMMTDESSFKRGLAALDFGGDFTPIAPITSGINFAGGLAYDFLNSKFMDRFGGKDMAKGLDKAAESVIKPLGKGIKATQKAWSSMKNTAKAIKQKGLRSSLKAGMSLVKKKTPQPIKNALKGYANMYLHPIQTWKKAGTFLANKSKDMFKKPKLKNYNDIYYRNLALSKNKQHAINHNGEVVQTKLQGSQIDNSNKNNFTINITGTNKSTQEIMNEIVPEIKLRMKNISVA